jgi:hypothetical protein
VSPRLQAFVRFDLTSLADCTRVRVDEGGAVILPDPAPVCIWSLYK